MLYSFGRGFLSPMRGQYPKYAYGPYFIIIFLISLESTGLINISYIFISFVVSRAFMAGAASQAGDADSSRAPGLTSGLQGSVNVHRGALLLVPQ